VDRAVLDVRADLAVMGDRPRIRNLRLRSRPDPGAGGLLTPCLPAHLRHPGRPATGSASGPLGAYLVRHGLAKKAASEDRQRAGDPDGRQSFIHIRLAMQGDEIATIRVGGSAVPVLDES